MVLRYTALILAQFAVASLLSGQVRLDSDPSTPVSYFEGPVADFNGDNWDELSPDEFKCVGNTAYVAVY